MNVPSAVRLLYLGRNSAFARQIQETLCAEVSTLAPSMRHRLQFVHVSSQKDTMHEMRLVPCHGLFLELDGRKGGRKRFCNTLRRRYPDLCIIAVGEKRHQRNAGGDFDGFLARPLREDQARPILQLLLNGTSGTVLVAGPIRLDRTTRTVSGPAGRDKLPPKLCDLLSLFMENQGETVNRKQIMQAVWQTEYLEDTRTLDVHMRWLRERIEPNPSRPRYLVTVRGEGYQLQV